MSVYQIEIESQNPQDSMVSVTLLQTLLSVLIDGSKGALRLRTEGRSTARGVPPQWLQVATQFSMELQGGKLDVESPTLYEAGAELFQQSDWFEELDFERTSFDYFQESLIAALSHEMADSLYDKHLLEAFQRFRHVFNNGAKAIHFLSEKAIQITPDTITVFNELAASLPFPHQVKVAGKLEELRTYDQTFKLITAQGDHAIKGIAKHIAPPEVNALLNKEVLMSGTAYFTTSGKILRIEAEHILAAGARELALWGKLPVPMPY
ncbi:MAG: hypothetical protein DRR19_30050 [Candidatus Parabeggiatoa sp. nov. 1]|nr:MAG: hypothetical protein DRR19_30050 [Gammaproteobacteria bacterium]